jgi:C terminal of Calcineurin-like phosphoesterase/Calcineurin-like phosphoesterase/N terminal of Calcineurin-like phosphoesterase
VDFVLSRRAFLARATAMGASVVLLPAMASSSNAATTEASEEMASGIVFEDTAGNGIRTADKKGIEGVLVSNGREVVRTDHEGKYRLGIHDGDMVFVIKPQHWKTPFSEYNLPKFYYFHRPTGSPEWRPTTVAGAEKLDPSWYYAGSRPTGPLPASIDFPLVRSPEPDEFKVLVFGDTQVTHERQLQYMAHDTLAELVDVPGVAFGLSIGDLVNVGKLHMFEPLNSMQVNTGIPWYVIPGNHDQNMIVPNDEMADETFRSIYGPAMYAFDYGSVSFLMLENIMRHPFTKVDATGTGPMGDDYGCGLRDDQWEFVENYLKEVPKDRQLVICMHIPITGTADDAKAYSRRLLNLISGRPYTLSMSGHTHIQRHTFHGAADGFSGPGEHHHFNSICVRGDGYRGMFDELQLPCCLAVDGTPNGYSFIEFTKTGYAIRYKGSRQPENYQMNIFVSPRIRRSRVKSEMVKANVFAGSPRSKVRMRVNKGAWQPMELSPQEDPNMKWVFETQSQPKPWLGSNYNRDAIPDSYHIWQAPLPRVLAEGTHRVEVESVDMFGRTDRATSLFRVMPNAGEVAPAGDA